MTRKEYQEKRNSLIDEAQTLINEGKLEDYEAKRTEIEQLDNSFEQQSVAQANLEALAGTRQHTSLENLNMSAGGIVDTTRATSSNDDIYSSLEYRKAFMNHVLKDEQIPAEFRNDSATTGDIGPVIPSTVIEKIIEKMETCGNILPLVTRTSYKGGVAIPLSDVKPKATWVAEGSGSAKQKKKITGTITFAYHKLRCAVAVSLEVDTMALPVFETTLINNVSEAMVKAVEETIFTGDGIGKPEGVLAKDAPNGQNIVITKTGKFTYKTLTDTEGALPLAYENGARWFMTKKTFMEFVGMTDDNGQPIARVTYGITGKPERTLLGRPVELNEYMISVDAVKTEDAVVAFLYDMKEYILNTNYNMTMKKYEDNETDDMVTKAIMLVDGKPADRSSLVTITKKAS